MKSKIIKLPVRKMRKVTIQKETQIIVVNFKSKKVTGETTFDNYQSEIISQWGETLPNHKKVA